MIFYFSGTGNSLWIAKQLSEGQKEEMYFIPELFRKEQFEFLLKEEEKVGFVFPIYSWGPPLIVLQFIQKLSLLAYHRQYMFFVCSCGDDIGLTQQIMEKALCEKGWTCNAGFSVVMPNNYVSFPGFDVDSKKLESEKLKNAVSAVVELNQLLLTQEHTFICKKGHFSFIKTKVINPLFNRYQLTSKYFWATDACTACGRCVKSCPVGNVVLENKKPVWGMHCTSCLACYHSCPQHAVQYGKQTRNKGQYFNPNI